MNYILHSYKIVLFFLVTCPLSIEAISEPEGSSYFFYQQPEYPRDCKEARDQCSSDHSSGVYIIKPDGYPQPFEANCNNDIEAGGWTVIQRRFDDSMAFKRNWEDYKSGFGFLSNEFWIGLKKLSYLTNQADCELRIDMVLSNGSSFYVKYNSFRISDEWSDYALVSADLFRSNWSCIVSTCPPNMTHESCTCQSLTMCTHPTGQTDCYTDCEETCVPEGCLVTETNSYILNGDSFINADCTQTCTCIGNQLSCNADYACSTDASCTVKDGFRKCHCNEGYEGDGETCIRNSFKDCYEAYQAGHTTDGVYTLLPTGWTGSAFTVFCDMTTAGGGWTVIQRRVDGVTDFYRGWDEYREGFGAREAGNDFWLGNEKMYNLTNQKDYKLRVDIVTSDGSSKYQEYASIRIDDESTKYRLSLGSSTGTAGNSLHSCSNGGQFSTRDQDNDGCSVHDFAKGNRGAWWYNSQECSHHCTACYYSYKYYCYDFETRSGCFNVGSVSNLNGDYNGGNGQDIFWSHYHCNLNSAEMKIRPSTL
ncbi:Angiopoietin-related protein 7 [Holothuria leucospilota]|uniref:Angiopoietin-related protein 7 n=1 Tax=Holothuria leucospilota TaxID=206669 RepID=A0A9Q1BV90_HOLLE|nr:Angiopoietin-related protein 7 [Holothuria leucospilota]